MIEQLYSKNYKSNLINLKLKYSKIIQIRKFWNLQIDKIQFPNLQREYKINKKDLNLLQNNNKLMIKIK